MAEETVQSLNRLETPAGPAGIWAPGEPYFALFRRRFVAGRGVSRAVAEITALSPEPGRQFVFDLFVNGAELGVGPSRIGKLPPSEGETDDRSELSVLYYNVYDFTASLKRGGETEEILVLCQAEEGKALWMRAAFYDDSGNQVDGFDTSGEGWEALNADPVFRPDNSIGTHYYKACAANIDAVKWRELCGCGPEDPGTAEGGFARPVVKPGAFDGYVFARWQTGPVKHFEEIVPEQNVRKTGGGYFIDLGREIVGGIGLLIEAEAQTELELRFGEELNSDGSVRYHMRTGNTYLAHWRVAPGRQYIAAPDMMTFRYAEILSDRPFRPEQVKALPLRADLDDGESSFSSDSELLQELYEFTKYTIKATTQDLYVDSQSRERGAYEGDMLINMLASYTFYGDTSAARATLEYLYTHRTWPAEYILLMPEAALADALQTGNLGSLHRYYPVLRDNNFLAFAGTHGLVHSGNRAGQGVNAVLYDWPPSERDGYDVDTAYPTVLNALQARSFLDMAEIARLLGRPEDAAVFEENAKRIAKALSELLFDAEQGAFCDGLYENGTRSTHCSQHASAYVLYCLGEKKRRLIPDRQAEAACTFLNAQKRLKTSVYGAYFVLEGLYHSGVKGASETATALLLNEDPEDRRTWAYMLRRLGATITTEAWCPEHKPNMTFSHPWGAAPAALISRGIFGIEPLEPGWKRFRVDFRRAGLDRASITVPCLRGSVKASFDGDRYEVTVPPDSRAEIFVDGEPVPGGQDLGPGEYGFDF
jgi:alpha-L-rhamnosidase